MSSSVDNVKAAFMGREGESSGGSSPWEPVCCPDDGNREFRAEITQAD